MVNLSLGDKLSPDISFYFKDITSLFQKMIEIENFQKLHRNRCMEAEVRKRLIDDIVKVKSYRERSEKYSPYFAQVYSILCTKYGLKPTREYVDYTPAQIDVFVEELRAYQQQRQQHQHQTKRQHQQLATPSFVSNDRGGNAMELDDRSSSYSTPMIQGSPVGSAGGSSVITVGRSSRPQSSLFRTQVQNVAPTTNLGSAGTTNLILSGRIGTGTTNLGGRISTAGAGGRMAPAIGGGRSASTMVAGKITPTSRDTRLTPPSGGGRITPTSGGSRTTPTSGSGGITPGSRVSPISGRSRVTPTSGGGRITPTGGISTRPSPLLSSSRAIAQSFPSHFQQQANRLHLHKPTTAKPSSTFTPIHAKIKQVMLSSGPPQLAGNGPMSTPPGQRSLDTPGSRVICGFKPLATPINRSLALPLSSRPLPLSCRAPGSVQTFIGGSMPQMNRLQECEYM